MKSIRSNSRKTDRPFGFGKTSRCIIIAACTIIAIGYLLMAVYGSTDQAFHAQVFDTQRIKVAPICCLIGYLLIAVGIIAKK